MKTLSIKQPWAWLIAHGRKDIENRDWQTSHRGPFLIHAGKEVDAHGLEWVEQNMIDIPLPDKHDLGGIVGYGCIADCVESSTSPWFFGKYGFEVSNASPLPFTPLLGQLEFFDCNVTPGNVQVIDVRGLSGDDRNGTDYIGRDFAGWAEVPLRNKSGGVAEYKRWLWGEIKSGGDAYRQLLDIAARVAIGQDVRLGCWCKSKGESTPCHGDVVRGAVEWIVNG